MTTRDLVLLFFAGALVAVGVGMLLTLWGLYAGGVTLCNI